MGPQESKVSLVTKSSQEGIRKDSSTWSKMGLRSCWLKGSPGYKERWLFPEALLQGSPKSPWLIMHIRMLGAHRLRERLEAGRGIGEDVAEFQLWDKVGVQYSSRGERRYRCCVIAG